MIKKNEINKATMIPFLKSARIKVKKLKVVTKSNNKKSIKELILSPKRSIGNFGLNVFTNKINPIRESANISK